MGMWLPGGCFLIEHRIKCSIISLSVKLNVIGGIEPPIDLSLNINRLLNTPAEQLKGGWFKGSYRHRSPLQIGIGDTIPGRLANGNFQVRLLVVNPLMTKVGLLG